MPSSCTQSHLLIYYYLLLLNKAHCFCTINAICAQYKKIDKIPKTAGKQKQLPVKNRFAVLQGEGAGGVMEWEVGAGTCKLLYKERTHSKVPLHSIENCIHYLLINHYGKESFKITCSLKSHR